MLKEKLKIERNKKKISQRELANIIGVSQQTIGSWETGRTQPDQDALKQLANFFNVSLDYLMGVTDVRNYINIEHPLAISKKQKISYDDFMETAKVFFMDASEEDREAITRDISSLYWTSKEINKKKYAPSNKKK